MVQARGKCLKDSCPTHLEIVKERVQERTTAYFPDFPSDLMLLGKKEKEKKHAIYRNQL